MHSFRFLDMKPRSAEEVLTTLHDRASTHTTHDRVYADLNEKAHIGIYTLLERKDRVKRFVDRRETGNWSQQIKYNVRKKVADSRLRVKGRFVPKVDEQYLKEVMFLL